MAGAKRIRRTPEDARKLILDAAEAVMGPQGVAGLRLAEVAARAGVSHPTVLHHFGSREGLVQALNERAVAAMRGDLYAAMEGGTSSADAVGPVFRAYREGLAQRLIWMLQTDPQAALPQKMPVLEDLVQRMHALRQRLADPGVQLDPEDSRALVHLAALAAFGDAVIGPRLRGAPDQAAEQTRRAGFERWFAALMDRHIVTSGKAGVPSGKSGGKP